MTPAQVGELILVISRQDPSTVQKATKELEVLSRNPGYLPILVGLLKESMNSPVGQLCSIYIKSHVLNYWVPDEGDEHVISESDRAFMRSCLVEALVACPPLVKAQLVHALGIISHADYPSKWPGLLESLVNQLSLEATTALPILECLNAMFHHYRTAKESEGLWSEIKTVHTQFYPALQKLYEGFIGQFASAIAAVGANPGNAAQVDQLKQVCETLTFLVDILHSLNAQDISEAVETNLDFWFTPALQLLRTPASALPHRSEEESSKLDALHTAVVGLAALFARKYNEDFASQLPGFLEAVWSMLVSTSNLPRWDDLAGECLSFLSSVCSSKSLFNDGILTAIVERVAVPYLAVTEALEDQFLYSCDDYISRELDGDFDSRRGRTVVLLQQLVFFFGPTITPLALTHVDRLMTGDWRAKDQALRLLTAVAVVASTRQSGAVTLNPLVDVGRYFTSFVLTELQAGRTNAMLKASVLKFLSVFRSQLPRDFLVQAVGLVLPYLAYEEPVVHTLAAFVLDNLLALRTDAGALAVNAEQLPYEQVLTALFQTLTLPGASENDTVMSAILRLLVLLGPKVAGCAEKLLESVVGCVRHAVKTQGNAKFVHLLFEVLAQLVCTLVKAFGSPALAQFETVLFPIFQQLLASEFSAEAQSYVFQLVALMLESRTDVTAPYLALFPTLLQDQLLTTPANIYSITRLLTAYLQNGIANTNVFAPAMLESMLAVFQKANALSIYDGVSAKLAVAFAVYLPVPLATQLVPRVVRMHFQRLTVKKTDEFCEGVVTAWSAFALSVGADVLLQAMESMQKGASNMALNNVWRIHLGNLKGKWAKNIAWAGTLRVTLFLASQPNHPARSALDTLPWEAAMVATFANTDQSANAMVTDVLSAVGTNFTGKLNALAFGTQELRIVVPGNPKEILLSTDQQGVFQKIISQNDSGLRYLAQIMNM